MSELLLRTATAAGLLAAAYLWFFVAPWAAFSLGLALLVALLVWEGARMLALPAASLQALIAAACVGLAQTIGMLASFVALGLWSALSFAIQRHHAQHAAWFAQGWIVLWSVAAASVLLLAHAAPDARDWAVGVAISVWVADVAAYLVGRAWGRHRLCPAISPGKTIEGLIAALAFGGLAGTAWWLAQGWAWPSSVALALIAVLSGVMGDLSISSAKRLAGVKDSGNWLPGHGGLLDRLDALLLALPLGWIAWR